MSTVRLFAIECDGCGLRLGPQEAMAPLRKIAKVWGWTAIPGNGASRGLRTDRQDFCRKCSP